MSMAQTTMEVSPSNELHCSKCNAALPRQAAFCAACGERIARKDVVSLVHTETEIATRYRITSLVRRRPYLSLFFAIDNQQQRPVAIHEINIRGLQDEARTTACEVVQHEYDLLRRNHIPFLMPLIDLRQHQGHLYVVAGWPTTTSEKTDSSRLPALHTLQDVLQSGIGLPDMQIALTWIEQLCVTLDDLHRRQIILSDLDPQTLILNGESYTSELMLMASWLPSAIRDLLPPSSAISSITNFTAPEVLLDSSTPSSDVYSLGAILYLLLTGTAPEEPTARMQRRLHSPAELNFHISPALDEFVMQAIAVESAERFQSAREMGEALYRIRSGSKRTSAKRSPSTPLPAIVDANPVDENAHMRERKLEEIANIETILITPLSETSLKAWQAAKVPAADLPKPLQRPTSAEQATSTPVDELRSSKQEAVQDDEHSDLLPPPSSNIEDSSKNSLANNFKKRITGILPAIPRSQPARPLTSETLDTSTSTSSSAKDDSLLKQLQRLIRGEQKHATTAAAIIETPLRVQPNHSYTIRIQLMGRDKPLHSHAVEANKGTQVGGLSALTQGETIYIEVRSAIYQSYAYIVQQAAVSLPAQGYAAEVTIPMQPLSSGPNGRRDRLHIFFMDEMRHPLYEKPFVVELFISHMVQPGREGHNVLAIPV
ncbi:MAG: hypothetical protein NVSMB33_17670 [Ktedonobacteraceae bacterium]